MYSTRFALFAGLAFLSVTGVVCAGIVPAQAQTVPKSLQEGGPERALKDRKNAWTVGVAGGIFEGTYFRFAEEIRKVLDDGDEMRVMPIVSRGSASNLEDLLYVRGIDIAVTQSDVFEYFRTKRNISNLESRIHYILRFPIAEMHVIARKDIRSLEDLRGKKVDFGAPGASASLTGPIVFQRLGIQVQQIMENNPGAYGAGAYKKVIDGEVAAAVRVVGKPVGHIAQIPKDSGLHLVPIRFEQKFADYYALGEFTSAEYPNLVPPGQTVDTLAVPVVLAVYNWAKAGDRYRRVERFVERLFLNWDRFRKPPFHAKWRDVNLAATVPGWTRFDVVERELERTTGGLNRDFQAFLSRADNPRGALRNQADREALFREFMQWREKQGARAR